MNLKGISQKINLSKKQKYIVGGSSIILGLTTAAFLAEEQLEEVFDYIVYNIGDYLDAVPEIDTPEEMTIDLIKEPFEVEPSVIDYSSDGNPFTANEPEYFNYANPFIEKYEQLTNISSNSIEDKFVRAQIVLENPEFTEDGLRFNIDPNKIETAVNNFQNSGAYMPNLKPIEEARVLTTLDGINMGIEQVTTTLKEAPIITSPNDITLNSITTDNLMILEIQSGDNISNKAVEKIIDLINSQTPLNDAQKNRLYVKIINSMVENNNGLAPHMIHPGEKITICLDSIKDIINGNLSSLNKAIQTIGWSLPR